MSDPLRLDAAALALLGHDIVMVTDRERSLPTPCTGWNVTDLVRHLNERHEETLDRLVGPPPSRSEDPIADFPCVAARWVAALERAEGPVPVPQLGRSVPVTDLAMVHMLDMLVHRWDLRSALGLDCPTPERLTTAALPVARRLASPGGPLSGDHGVYGPARDTPAGLSPIRTLAALLGRDPDWTPPGPRSGSLA